MGSLIRKFLGFSMVSGVGWVIDFGIFFVLTHVLSLPILIANYLSSAVSVSFVFQVSTKKLLAARKDGLSLRAKYLMYLIYQLLLVGLVSLVAQQLYLWLISLELIASVPLLMANAELLAKILITPITMICNFFVLRYIVEQR